MCRRWGHGRRKKCTVKMVAEADMDRRAGVPHSQGPFPIAESREASVLMSVLAFFSSSKSHVLLPSSYNSVHTDQSLQGYVISAGCLQTV